MFHVYTPWKRQKTKCFLMFSGVQKWNIGLKWVKVIPENNEPKKGLQESTLKRNTFFS